MGVIGSCCCFKPLVFADFRGSIWGSSENALESYINSTSSASLVATAAEANIIFVSSHGATTISPTSGKRYVCVCDGIFGLASGFTGLGVTGALYYPGTWPTTTTDWNTSDYLADPAGGSVKLDNGVMNTGWSFTGGNKILGDGSGHNLLVETFSGGSSYVYIGDIQIFTGAYNGFSDPFYAEFIERVCTKKPQ